MSDGYFTNNLAYARSGSNVSLATMSPSIVFSNNVFILARGSAFVQSPGAPYFRATITGPPAAAFWSRVTRAWQAGLPLQDRRPLTANSSA